MAIHCAAAVHSGLIKNKEKKESSWVKLKAFATNDGRPNDRVPDTVCEHWHDVIGYAHDC